MAKNYREDIDLIPTDENSELYVLAKAIADKIGNCEVVDSTIYMLMLDFEIWDSHTDDFIEIENGIFAIYDVKPGKIITYSSNPQTCSQIELIGKKPLEYFTSGIDGEFDNLYDFIIALDNFFGRNWFGSPEEEEEFLYNYGDII